MFEKGFENAGVGFGEFLVSFGNEWSVRGGGITSDVRSKPPLAAHRSVHVKFGDMNGQAQRLHFRQ